MNRGNTHDDCVIVRVAGAEAARLFDPERLSAEDRIRYDRLRSPLHRQEFCASRAMKQHYAVLDRSTSLSHSGGIAAYASAPRGARVGVDLETHRPRKILSLARFAYSPEEASWLETETDPEGLFYVLWVGKEALAKAGGLSLFDALRNCRLLRHDGMWRAAVPIAQRWMIAILAPQPALSLAVAIVGEAAHETRVIVREWPAERDVEWPTVARIAGAAGASAS